MKRRCPPGMEHTVAEADRQIANAFKRHGGNVTDHIERLRDMVRCDKRWDIKQSHMWRTHRSDIADLLAERDRLAALLAEAEGALLPFVCYGIPIENLSHGFDRETIAAVSAARALLSKIAQQKGESDEHG